MFETTNQYKSIIQKSLSLIFSLPREKNSGWEIHHSRTITIDRLRCNSSSGLGGSKQKSNKI